MLVRGRAQCSRRGPFFVHAREHDMTQAPPAPQQPIEQPTPHQPTRPAIERRAVERLHAPRGADLMNQQSTLDGDD